MNKYFLIIALLSSLLVMGQSRDTSFSYKTLAQKISFAQKNILVYLIDDSTEVNSRIKNLIEDQKKQIDDSVIIFIQSTSKGYIEWNRFSKIKVESKDISLPKVEIETNQSFLKVHGNILYDVNYNSRIDTPYAEKNIYQHTIQTYLDITIKDQYPLRFYFTTRFSNSNLFRNLTDINLQFNSQDFSNRIKETLKSRLQHSINTDLISQLKSKLEKKLNELYALQEWFKNSSVTQRLVEDREGQLYRQAIENDTINLVRSNNLTAVFDKVSKSISIQQFNNVSVRKKTALADSLNSNLDVFAKEYDRNKNELESLQSQVIQLQQAYEEGKEKIKKQSDFFKNDIDAIKDIRSLQTKLSSAGVADSVLPKGYKFMLGLRSFKIGRSVIDYSELSAKNISITGLQVEYNPHNYFAFASGIVDYRFRDFIVRNYITPRQYLNLVRAGKGLKDGNNIIITYYSGKRQLYNSSTTVQGQQIPNYNLMGFTVEGQFKISRTSFIAAEVAKSSLPYYSLGERDKNLLRSTFKMNDHSNEAYAIKLVSFIPNTYTKIDGYYRNYGANFQSFSLFTTGTAQSSWAVRVDQPFFKRQLSITGSVRANDFSNPFVNQEYKSTAVFKSIQATLRIKKYPVVSLGYFPSSQLTKLNDGQYIENLFYTLTASANHFYRTRNALYNTSIVFTRFYNKAADSNFVYFNTKNLLVSQNILVNRFSFQFNFSGSGNGDYELYTVEHNLQYKLNNWLSLGGGIKYNKQTVYNKKLLGSSGNLLLKIPKAGELQFSMDNGFIPGNNKELVKNSFGRLTFFKIF